MFLGSMVKHEPHVNSSQQLHVPAASCVCCLPLSSGFFAHTASSMLGSLGSGALRLGSGPLSPSGRSFHHFLPDVASLSAAPDCSRRHELSTWDLDCTTLDKEALVRLTFGSGTGNTDLTVCFSVEGGLRSSKHADWHYVQREAGRVA
jgi:hypothetical protein